MPLDLDDPTAVALAIFRALSTRRIETALYGGLAEIADHDVAGRLTRLRQSA